MGVSARWFSRITVSVVREAVVLEIAPRHPLLSPGSPARTKKIASRISGVRNALARRH